jgi:hypothetical protein
MRTGTNTVSQTKKKRLARSAASHPPNWLYSQANGRFESAATGPGAACRDAVQFW